MHKIMHAYVNINQQEATITELKLHHIWMIQVKKLPNILNINILEVKPLTNI